MTRHPTIAGLALVASMTIGGQALACSDIDADIDGSGHGLSIHDTGCNIMRLHARGRNREADVPCAPTEDTKADSAASRAQEHGRTC